MKISNENIGNRSHDLPVCSAVPQPLRAPTKYCNKCSLRCWSLYPCNIYVSHNSIYQHLTNSLHLVDHHLPLKTVYKDLTNCLMFVPCIIRRSTQLGSTTNGTTTLLYTGHVITHYMTYHLLDLHFK
jgi:hypothetical protein